MDVKSRKKPQQARAKATVDAIVEATAQLLLHEGYDRFTTGRVAERAGVSIGSLYQYFPNKAALTAAVIDRCCDDFLGAFESAVADRRSRTLAGCIGAIVETTLVSHRLTPELHGIVRDLSRRIGVTEATRDISRLVAKAIEAALRKHADEIAPDIDIAAAAAIIETALEALAHRTGLIDPAHAEDNLLAKEATRLVAGYLTRRE